MTLLSIIIPIYNAETSIKKCIKSIQSQTLTDLEIICINDCSTDNTLNILNNLAKKDSRIKIHTTSSNSGAGLSRNKGIELTKGEYIAFLDSDDYIVDSNAYKTLINEAIKYDAPMVSGNIQFMFKEEIRRTHQYFPPIDSLKKLKPEQYGIPWYFYKNIFKKSVLIDNNILFPDLKWGEDPIFFTEILLNIDFYIHVPIWYYCYKLPEGNKLDSFEKYLDDAIGFKKVFEMLSSHDEFDSTLQTYSEILIDRERKDNHVSNEKEFNKLKKVYDDILENLRIKNKNTLYLPIKDSFDRSIEKTYNELFKNKQLKSSLKNNSNSLNNSHVISKEGYNKILELEKNILIKDKLLDSKEKELKEYKEKYTATKEDITILENKISELEKELITKNNIIKSKENEINHLNEFKNEVLSSNSWKLTKYLRFRSK